MIIIYTTYNIYKYIYIYKWKFCDWQNLSRIIEIEDGNDAPSFRNDSFDSNFERERQGDIGNRVNWFHGAVCLFTRCIDSPEQVPPGRPTSPPRIVVQPRPRPRPCWPLTTSRKPLQARSMSPFQLDPYCRPFLQQTVCHVDQRKIFPRNISKWISGTCHFRGGKI